MKLKPTLWIAALLLAGTGPALADGDAAHGKIVFGRCAVCHSLDAGKNLVGPSLKGVAGRKSGTVAGYQYSKGMAAAGLTWDDATLDKFLAAPSATVPGTKMLVGLPNPADRADVIAYLKSVN
ncbi:MAG: cytochrome c family protein [Rhodospirillales bacterium]|nr:cytochrome c family protein [Rhodospirillales bacterium]